MDIYILNGKMCIHRKVSFWSKMRQGLPKGNAHRRLTGVCWKPLSIVTVQSIQKLEMFLLNLGISDTRQISLRFLKKYSSTLGPDHSTMPAFVLPMRAVRYLLN